MASIMTSRQAAELDHAFERNGFTPGLVKKLSEGETLSMVLEVLLGRAEILKVTHIIDCDADPFVPPGLKVESHHKCGQLEWREGLFGLYFSELQGSSSAVCGDKLLEELKDKPVLNANVLDYLLKNPQLIPEEWKSKAVFFWGTIYCDPDDCPCIRYLYSGNGKPTAFEYWLGEKFTSLSAAAVLSL